MCDVQMSGNHAENLMRHLKRKHEDVYKDVLEAKKKKEDGNNNMQRHMTDFFQTNAKNTKECETIKVIKSEFLDGCVEMVTINGRPLKMLEDSGFRKIVNPICKALGVQVNRQNIREEIIKRSEALRSNIRSSLKNKYVSTQTQIP